MEATAIYGISLTPLLNSLTVDFSPSPFGHRAKVKFSEF